MVALNSILFYFFSALAIASAILMVTRRNIVHGAVFLITTLLATAQAFFYCSKLNFCSMSCR